MKLGDVSGNLGEKPRGITGICSANLLNKEALATLRVGVQTRHCAKVKLKSL